jgi:hypothetical protein
LRKSSRPPDQLRCGHRRVRLAPIASAVTLVLAATGCDRPSSSLPPPIAAVERERDAPAVDRFEVWLCHVPADTSDPVYADDPGRLDASPAALVERFAAGVGAYWTTVTHGQYQPVFSAGGEVEIGATDTSEVCIDRALAAAGDGSDAVLVIADAQHADDQPGGRAAPGSWLTCTDSCSARATGRYVYLGANDFFVPAETMPFDLIEHEMGHSLGLPHSGAGTTTNENTATGPYDVMANPASARAIDPSRRDAPDLIAVNRLQLGWLAPDAVAVADRSVERVELAPSTGPEGVRLLVAPIDDHRALTVELLPDSGFDDHLPTSGVVVHLIDDSPASCDTTTRCVALERRQLVVGTGSGIDMLRAGDLLVQWGWRVRVESLTDGHAIVAVAPDRS